ncbi:uncharacterized protein [Ptychodera flava]|uniref:uncharacterized protein n=1 Tax=Ptychodera flava TaxID=63121 RepID=UPI003969F5F2
MYMDEFSRELADDKIVADKWSDFWKDETFEFRLHRKNRCFTVWDKFNIKQLQTILRYLTTLQLGHLTGESRDVLYIGTKQNAEEFHRHLLANSFLEQLKFTEGHSNVSVSEYRHYLSYLYRKENKLTLWTINLPLFNFCGGDDLQARIPKLKQDVLANDLRNSMQPLQWLQRFDLVIIHCHCDTCFLHLYRDSYQLKSEIAGVLGCLELQVQSRNIKPFISEQYAECVHTTVRDIVTKMFDECPGRVGYEDTSLTVLSGLPVSIVLNVYSWHLCLTPTGSCHKQGIDSDEVECIVPRKVKYIAFGFAVSVVILVIVLVITSL